MSGPAPKVTEKLHDEIVLFYAQNGAKHGECRKKFGLGHRTVTRLYHEGYKPLDKPPIKSVLQTVEVKARAQRAKVKTAELKKAEAEIERIIRGSADPEAGNIIRDAQEARAHEGLMIAGARKNAIAMQAIVGSLLSGAARRVRDIEKYLASNDRDGMPVEKLLRYLTDIAKLVNDLNSASKATMDMERMLLGDPEEAIKDSQGKLSAEESSAILALASRTFLRLQRDGKIVEAAGQIVVGEQVSLPAPKAELIEAEDEDDEADGEYEEDEGEPYVDVEGDVD